MNILFIGYWAFHEGLTASTILPHLRILSSFTEVDKIIFTSIERNLAVKSFAIDIPKVIHVPLYSSISQNVFINKLHDFTQFPKMLAGFIHEHQIDIMICRGAPAGALGYLVWQKTKVPFAVESFEPHGEYMLESGVWKRYDPRYLLEMYWEKKQKKYAKALLPVAHNYKQQLEQENIACKNIYVVPCTVNLSKFSFQETERKRIRAQYNIAEDVVVGIYVGKFGGLYLDNEAFDVFLAVLNQFPKTFLFLLTPEDEKVINEKMQKTKGFNIQVQTLLARHEEVPQYLSAADIAFATYKPSPSKKYLSPIKVGEYWANGLPVVITPGIGDDSEIIENEGGGVVYDLTKPEQSLAKIKNLMALGRQHHVNTIVPLAKKYRSIYIVEEVYEKLLQQ